jgi:hypothetical protein
MGLQLMTLTVDTVSNYSFINDIASKALTKSPETLSQYWAEFIIISFFGCIVAQIACVFLLVHTLYGEYKERPEDQTFALESRRMAVGYLMADVTFEMILLILSSVLFLQYDFETVGPFVLILFGCILTVHTAGFEYVSLARLDDPRTDVELEYFGTRIKSLF